MPSKLRSSYLKLAQKFFILLAGFFFAFFAFKFGVETKKGIETEIIGKQLLSQSVESTHLGEHLLTNVSSIVETLQTISLVPTIKTGDYIVCEPLLREFKLKFPVNIIHLSRLDTTGLVTCSSDTATKGKSWASYDHIQKITKDISHDPVISRIVQLEEGKEGTIGLQIVVPLLDINQIFLGTLMAEVSLPSLYKTAVTKFEVPPNSYLLLLDENLDIFYSSLPNLIGDNLSKSNVQDKLGTNGDIKDLIFSLKNGISDLDIYKFTGNKEYLVTYSYAQVLPSRKFISLVATPKQFHIKAIAPLLTSFTYKIVFIISMFAFVTLMMLVVENMREHSLHNLQETQRYKVAVENSNDLVVITDPEGIVLYANASLERVTGYLKNEVLGTKAGRLWGGIMPKDFYEKMWATIKDRRSTFAGVIKNKRKSGQYYESMVSAIPILDNGEITCIVCVQKDMSHDKEIDRIKSEFITLASLQLRTPVSSVLWALELLLKGDAGKPTSKQEELMQDSYKTMRKMSETLDNLLNIHKVETGQIVVNPKSQSVVTILKSTVEELQHLTTEKHQKIVIENLLTTTEYLVDDEILRTLYSNLLSNACKYSPENTEILVKFYQQHNDVIVQIKDRGYGIPKDAQQYVFDKFFRAKNISSLEVNGTGLGLYLAKQVVELIKGRIWFESVENQGSSFYFTFPVSGMPKVEGVVKLS